MTLQDIGAHYGVSRERARQLEAALMDAHAQVHARRDPRLRPRRRGRARLRVRACRGSLNMRCRWVLPSRVLEQEPAVDHHDVQQRAAQHRNGESQARAGVEGNGAVDASSHTKAEDQHVGHGPLDPVLLQEARSCAANGLDASLHERLR